MKNLNTLLNNLWAAPLGKLKEVAREAGDVAPVGDGDAKTAAPGTYRPVGDTCPADCGLLDNGCYAQMGNVAMHERRAASTAGPSIRAAALAMVWAARTQRAARLHVSGDFLSRGRVDVHYIRSLAFIGRWLRTKMRRPERVNAWTYTHIARKRFAAHAEMLREAGIHVRFSEDAGAMGAVVLPFDRVDELRARGVKTLKCLAQLTNKTCSECQACWTQTDHVIVFDPHGPGHKKAAAVGLRVLQ
jgi:hypothetical protein